MECQGLHKDRCDQEALYNLFFFPAYNSFLDDFLECSLRVIEKKYGSALSKCLSVKRAIRLLREIHDDQTIRRFAILFLVEWETELKKALEEQTSRKDHFRAYIAHINGFVEKTIRFSYNRHNIIEIVDEFERAARLEYIMGPLTTYSNSSL